MTGFHLAALAASAALLVGSAAWAEQARPALPPEVGGVIACARIAEPTARLACLDKAVAALQAAASSGDLVTLNRQQITKAQRENFGLVNPKQPGAGADLSQANFEVASAHQGPDGRWVLVLQDGGRWRLTENEQLGRLPRSGSKVHIDKGALGSFFINLDGQRGLRAERIDGQR